MKVDTPTHNKSSRALEIIGWILLSAYVIVLPIGHTTALRNLLFFSLIAITVWLAWRGKIQLSVPIIKPWLFYAAVAFVSLTYAVDPWYSLGEIKTEIGFGFIAMVLGATWIRTSDQFSRLMLSVIACNIFLLAISFFYTWPALTNPDTRPVGTSLLIGSFNIGTGKFSTYIVIVLPLLIAYCLQLPKRLYKLKTLLLILLVTGNITALYFTGNRLGLVALILEIGVLIIFLLKHLFFARSHSIIRKGLTLTSIVLAIAILSILEAKQIRNRDQITVNVSSAVSSAIFSDSRWSIWKFSIQNIEARPFTGGGFGLHAFKMLNPDYSKNNPEHNPLLWHAHNTLLNVGVQTGLPGMTAFVILMAAALLQVSLPLRKSHEWNPTRLYSMAGVIMFAGLAVKLQTDDFFSRDIALFFWLIVGTLSFSATAPRH